MEGNSPDPSPSEAASAILSSQQINLLRVAGDILIIFALIITATFIFTTIASVFGFHDTPMFWVITLLLTWGLLIAGFTASGCLVEAPVRRTHVFLVALGLWLLKWIDAFFIEFSVIGWLLSSVLLGVLALIGNGLAYLIRGDFTYSDGNTGRN